MCEKRKQKKGNTVIYFISFFTFFSLCFYKIFIFLFSFFVEIHPFILHLLHHHYHHYRLLMAAINIIIIKHYLCYIFCLFLLSFVKQQQLSDTFYRFFLLFIFLSNFPLPPVRVCEM